MRVPRRNRSSGVDAKLARLRRRSNGAAVAPSWRYPLCGFLSSRARYSPSPPARGVSGTARAPRGLALDRSSERKRKQNLVKQEGKKREQGGAPCFLALPTDLCELVGRVRGSALAIRVAEAEHAHSLAVLARASIGRHVTGDVTAMEACAEEVGVARRTLAAFSVIATRWDPLELRALLEQRGVDGHALSVSQLLLLASLPRASREYWTERVFREALDVRALRLLMREAHPDSEESGALSSGSI